MEGQNRPPEGPRSDRPDWAPPVPPGRPPPTWPPPEAPRAPTWQPPAAPPYGGGPHGPPGTWSGRQLGGWWQRVGATLLDWLIVGFPVLVILVAVDFGLGLLLGLTATLTYYPLLMMREGPANGQTLGKQITGIRVVQVSGEPFTYGAGALREFAVKYLLFGTVGGFFLAIPTLLDYLWPLWDDENRALHDMLASTRVVQA